MGDKTNIKERTNPVFNTAKATLYQFAMAGEKDAVLMAEKLGLKIENVAENDEQKKAMSRGNSVAAEARYRSMSRFILDSGKKNVVDLPCGYTPRALYMAAKGINYIGCDLPAVIEDMKPLTEQLLKEQGLSGAEYKSVDATNLQSLEEAVKGVEGEICISTEGLLMYLNPSEIDALCENVREILSRHGGCWMTPDPECMYMAFATMSAIFGKEKAIEIFQASRKMFSSKAALDLPDNDMLVKMGEDGSKARNCLAKHGLKAERIPMASKLSELHALEGMPQEMKDAVMAALQNVGVWVITCDGEQRKSGEKNQTHTDFSMKQEADGESLIIHLAGRVDSITAPDFLEKYEQEAQNKEYKDVIVDCEQLEYMSSAGLRVLMIIAKQHQEHVFLKGVKPEVAAVLEQTGFDQIVKINE